MPLLFEWDPEKAGTNRRKHGIDFEEASTVFADLFSVTIPDVKHSRDESRWITLGKSSRENLLVVVHTEYGDSLRLISARLATRRERKQYEEEL